jgi:hypothetical protein
MPRSPGDRQRLSFLQHNAHVSGAFAKATGAVEEDYFLAPGL